MSDKLLTIIIPSYNMENFLPKCLGSMVVNDAVLMDKLDIIVVNDGSKDKTNEIAHEWEAKYPGIVRVIDKLNGHYGSCINAALPVAKGLYVKVIDADDWVDTEAFKRYLRFVAQASSRIEDAPDMIMSNFVFVTNEGRVVKDYSYCAEPGFDVSQFNFQCGRDPWMHAIAYRTDNLRKLGYVQLTGITHTDVQWLHLPMAMVKKIAYCPETVYQYWEVRDGNTCGGDAIFRTYPDLLKVTLQLLKEYRERVNEFGEAQRKYLLRHILHRVSRGYATYIFEKNRWLKRADLRWFDKQIADNEPWVYDLLANNSGQDGVRGRYIILYHRLRNVPLAFHSLIFVWNSFRRALQLVSHIRNHGLRFALGKVKRMVLRQGEYKQR